MPAEVAVLMPAYNADRTIREAVDSALASTVPCDIFIVDDCSRVPVADVLGSIDRVEIVRLARNQGPALARNEGLRLILSRGYRYVAILDADDTTIPERFAKQLAFLKANPNVAAVGGGQRCFDDESGRTLYYLTPPSDAESIRRAMFFNITLGHSTVMMRTQALAEAGFYSPDYPAAEDYELLRRLASRFDLANLPECLINYRISPTSVSITRRRRQLFDRLRIQLHYFVPLEWRAWAGVANTLALFVVPRVLVTALKSLRDGTSTRLDPRHS